MCQPPKLAFIVATPKSCEKSELFVHAVLDCRDAADQVPYGRGLARSSSYAGTKVQLLCHVPPWPPWTQWPAVQTESLPSELMIVPEQTYAWPPLTKKTLPAV